jgi:hypothetical protein
MKTADSCAYRFGRLKRILGAKNPTKSTPRARPTSLNVPTDRKLRAGQREQNPAATNTADNGERTALKRVTLAGDRYGTGEIPAMGSLSPFPSTRSRIKT